MKVIRKTTLLKEHSGGTQPKIHILAHKHTYTINTIRYSRAIQAVSVCRLYEYSLGALVSSHSPKICRSCYSAKRKINAKTPPKHLAQERTACIKISSYITGTWLLHSSVYRWPKINGSLRYLDCTIAALQSKIKIPNLKFILYIFDSFIQ